MHRYSFLCRIMKDVLNTDEAVPAMSDKPIVVPKAIGTCPTGPTRQENGFRDL
jgi:hypothetical protein